MEKLKDLQKQLAEMRRLQLHRIPAQSLKYRELIAQVYEELKKLSDIHGAFYEPDPLLLSMC